MSATHCPSRFAVTLAFGLVYLFWGSTYLAIDIAVESIPPALMCGVRFSIAGVVMLAVCAATGRRIWYSARQIALAAVVGLLLLMGGNLTLSWAEQTVPSGLAALIIAITPLWFLVLDSLLLGHHRISKRGKAGLALGMVGLLVLFWPELHRSFGWTAGRIVLVGAGIGAVEALAVRHGRFQCNRLASDGSGRR
jgi:drug/metabolite transporter (DMT)-like permease